MDCFGAETKFGGTLEQATRAISGSNFVCLAGGDKNKPGLRICDFRKQRGIYILYGDLGAHYVGLTRQQDLGKRLKDHTNANGIASAGLAFAQSLMETMNMGCTN